MPHPKNRQHDRQHDRRDDRRDDRTVFFPKTAGKPHDNRTITARYGKTPSLANAPTRSLSGNRSRAHFNALFYGL